jgi:hypothetical protein
VYRGGVECPREDKRVDAGGIDAGVGQVGLRRALENVSHEKELIT